MSPLLIETASNTFWLPVILLVFALVALEGERAWTRGRRGRGLQPGSVAYLLDGLMVVFVVLSLISFVALLVRGGLALLALIGAGFGWAGNQVNTNPLLVSLVVVSIAVVAGIALVLRRGPNRGRAALDATGWAADSGGSPLVAPPPSASISSPSSAPVPAMAGSSERRSVYVSVAQDSFAEESLPSMSMLQNRQRAAAAPIPKSFLELAEPKEPSTPPRRSGSVLVPVLLLVIVVLLVSGILLFRQQIIAALPRMSSAQPAIAGQNAAANLAATAAPSQAQPTPVATTAPAASGGTPDVTMHVTSDKLNVRVAPGTEQGLVFVLSKGETVTLLKEMRVIGDTTWVKVRAGDREGWVSKAFLE